MTADEFRRIALSLDGAEESSHMGVPDFRVGGHIFATLASQDEGFGNLKLTPELVYLRDVSNSDTSFIRASCSTGFTRWPSKPASFDFWRSSG